MNKMMFQFAALAIAATSTTTAMATPTSAGISKAASGRLPAFLACLQKQKTAIVVAHRGGPLAEHPENAIVTFDYTTSLAPVFLEVDVQQTVDDVLFLEHDGVLERTTTGTGAISDKFSIEVEMVKQRDPFATPTGYTPPRLADALAWSKGRAILILDIKPRTDAALVAKEVKAAGLQASVITNVYTIKQALAVRAVLPDAVLAMAIGTQDAFDQAKAAGLVGPQIIAFTPLGKTGNPIARDLKALGATSITGSFFGPETADAKYRTIKDAPLYQNLLASGAELILSNRPLDAVNALSADPVYWDKLKGVTTRK